VLDDDAHALEGSCPYASLARLRRLAHHLSNAACAHIHARGRRAVRPREGSAPRTRCRSKGAPAPARTLTCMSMLRSCSRVKFSSQNSSEFCSATTAARRVSSGFPGLIPSTMAVSTCGYNGVVVGVGHIDVVGGGWWFLLGLVARVVFASKNWLRRVRNIAFQNLFIFCMSSRRHLVGLLRVKVAHVQLLAHVPGSYIEVKPKRAEDLRRS